METPEQLKAKELRLLRGAWKEGIDIGDTREVDSSA